MDCTPCCKRGYAERTVPYAGHASPHDEESPTSTPRNVQRRISCYMLWGSFDSMSSARGSGDVPSAELIRQSRAALHCSSEERAGRNRRGIPGGNSTGFKSHLSHRGRGVDDTFWYRACVHPAAVLFMFRWASAKTHVRRTLMVRVARFHLGVRTTTHV